MVQLEQKSKVAIATSNGDGTYITVEPDILLKRIESEVGGLDYKAKEAVTLSENFEPMVRKLSYEHHEKVQTVSVELHQEKIAVRLLWANRSNVDADDFMKDYLRKKIDLTDEEYKHIEKLQSNGTADFFFTYRSRLGLMYLMTADVSIRGQFTVQPKSVRILQPDRMHTHGRKDVFIPNVYENGTVCWGNGGKSAKLTVANFEEFGKVPSLFFNSYFNNDLSTISSWNEKKDKKLLEYLEHYAEIQNDKVVKNIVKRLGKQKSLGINCIEIVLGLVNLVKGDIGNLVY